MSKSVAEPISAEEARRAALAAQGLDGSHRPADATEAVSMLAAVQIDVIAVLARSHELVCSARLGPVESGGINSQLWGCTPPTTFEYLAHAACVLPISSWPLFGFRRRKEQRTHNKKPSIDEATLAEVRSALELGPVTVTDLGGAGRVGRFGNVSGAKAAAEVLYLTGEAVCADRQTFKRVYDLPARVVPSELLATDMTDEECIAELVRLAVRAMGVATRSDIADYFRLGLREVSEGLAACELAEVDVAGWGEPAWIDPTRFDASVPPTGSRAVLLSPFDSLIWDRKRTERLFGFSLIFEAYKPAAQRLRGYYTMPLLVGEDLVGWVDPVRRDGTLALAGAELTTPGSVEALAAALREAAAWTACTDIDPTVPGQRRLTAELECALR